MLVYIAVLFLAAFLLLGISLIQNQRSSTEALQSNLSTMQEVQATQDKILALQEDLSALRSDLDEQRTAAETAERDAEEARREAEALRMLYVLQQKWLNRDLDGCKAALQTMTDRGLVSLLPDREEDGVVSPAQRYEQLKEAVLNP
ncbi:MAG: hypothetical protein IKN53_02170 [Oscillibacter sp.]|nr:hypothetical protein [Oscillibacter sp.]